MSLDLYGTALIWHGRRGAAKLHGRQIMLQQVPALLGSPVAMIDDRPEVGAGRIQRVDGPAGDMSAQELEQANAYLQGVLARPA